MCAFVLKTCRNKKGKCVHDDDDDDDEDEDVLGRF